MEGCKGWFLKGLPYESTQIFLGVRDFLYLSELVITLGAHPMQCIIALQSLNIIVVFKLFVLCMAVITNKREMHK